MAGADEVEDPHVPIPNTEVKLSGAEDTWLVTARKNREMPTYKVSTQWGGRFFILFLLCKPVGAFIAKTITMPYTLIGVSLCLI